MSSATTSPSAAPPPPPPKKPTSLPPPPDPRLLARKLPSDSQLPVLKAQHAEADRLEVEQQQQQENHVADAEEAETSASRKRRSNSLHDLRKSAELAAPPPPLRLEIKLPPAPARPPQTEPTKGGDETATPPRLRTSLQISTPPVTASPPGGAETTPTVYILDDEQRRGKVIIEMYDSERVYANLLSEFHNSFMKPLETGADPTARDFMSRPNLAGLCSNIEQIGHLSEQLCKELENALRSVGCYYGGAALERVGASTQGRSIAIENDRAGTAARMAARAPIGTIFTRFATLLPLYQQYVENHAFARSDITEFLENKQFKAFLDKCAEDLRALREKRLAERKTMTSEQIANGKPAKGPMVTNATHTTTLDGFFILPIQRIPRYVLLLKEMAKFTNRIVNDGVSTSSNPSSAPNTPLINGAYTMKFDEETLAYYANERMALASALNDVSLAAHRMNDMIRISENAKSMADLQKRFVGGAVELVGGENGSRRLVREGSLMRVTQSSRKHHLFYFHLLSDLLIYSEELGNQSYKLHRVIALDGQCKVITNLDPSTSPVGHPKYEAFTEADTLERMASSSGTTATTTTTSHAPGTPSPLSGSSFSNRRKTAMSPLLRRLSKGVIPPPTRAQEGSHAAAPEGNGATTTSTPPSDWSTCFQIATTVKTLTLYAPSIRVKNEWVRDISQCIGQLAKARAGGVSVTPLYAPETTARECVICAEEFTLVKRQKNCKRCGIAVCTSCRNRVRVLNRGHPIKCCDVCRLEMDLSAKDDQAERFRLSLHVHSVSGLGLLCRANGDRKDPLANCYFVLTQVSSKNGPGMRRGPSSVGSEAFFTFPVGPQGNSADVTDSYKWILRVYLLESGEVGTVTLDVRELMTEPSMLEHQTLERRYDVKPTSATAATPKSKGGSGGNNNESKDELALDEDSLPVITLSFRLRTPPALWRPHGETEDPSSALLKRADSGASAMSLETPKPAGTPRTPTTPAESSDPAHIAVLDEAVDARISARLKRFEFDDESSERGVPLAVNPAILSLYEKRFLERPSHFSLCCVDYLYASCRDAFYRDKDERLTEIATRRLLFHHHPIAQIVHKEEEERLQKAKKLARGSFLSLPALSAGGAGGGGTNSASNASAGGTSDLSMGALLQHHASRSTSPAFASESSSRVLIPSNATATSSPASAASAGTPTSEDRRDGSLSGMSSRAQEFFELTSSSISGKKPPPLSPLLTGVVLKPNSTTEASNASSPQVVAGAASSSSSARELVLLDLIRTERAYFESLRVLDEVFVDPLMRVAHGASAEMIASTILGVNKKTDPGSAASSSVLDNGMFTSRGRRRRYSGWSSLLPTSLLPASAATAAARQRHWTSTYTKSVATIVKLPDVMVLLQSIRQIMTVNEQLLSDLEARLHSTPAADKESMCIGDVFARFAVVLKVYNTYTTKHASLERILGAAASKSDVGGAETNRRSGSHLAGAASAGAAGTGASSPSATTSKTSELLRKRRWSASSALSSLFGADGEDGAGGGGSSGLAPGILRARPDFLNFVRVLENDDRCQTILTRMPAKRREMFFQLTRLPGERLARYKRALSLLLMHTPPQHPDHKPLRDSLALLRDSESHISWSMRSMANQERVQVIERSFVRSFGSRRVLPKSLSASSTWYEMEGYLVKRSRKSDGLFKFWLFEDSIIYGTRAKTTALGSPQFVFHRQLMLNSTFIEDLPEGSVTARGDEDEKDSKGDFRFAFVIRSRVKSFVVMVPRVLYDAHLLRREDEGGGDVSQRRSLPREQGSPASPSGETTHGTSLVPAPVAPVTSNHVHRLATDEEKRRIKAMWLNAVQRCIAQSKPNEDDEDEDLVGPRIDNSRKSYRAGAAPIDTSTILKKHMDVVGKEAAPVWAPDQSLTGCTLCQRTFTFIKRRHHCRRCGALVCNDCSLNRAILANIHENKPVRVCMRCTDALRSANQNEAS